jgi:anti-anti-sigma factor
MVNDDIVFGFDDEKDASLKINLQQVSGVKNALVLALTGHIDTYNAHYFQKQVKKAIEAGFVRLIFNCNGLNYISSAGIGSLTISLKTVKLQGGDLMLFELQPTVHEILQLLNFSRVFNIRGTLKDSVSFFRSDIAEQTVGFPIKFPCPVCSKKLKAVKTGHFQCSACKTILTVDNTGSISLG